MTDQLNTIRSQKSRGLCNQVVSINKEVPKTSKRRPAFNMRGGDLTLTQDQADEILKTLGTIDNKDQEGYQDLLNAASSENKILPGYNDYDTDVREKLGQLVANSGKIQQTETLEQNVNPPVVNTDPLLDETGVPLLPAESEQTQIIPPGGEKSQTEVQIRAYETLTPKTILFHPSQDVKRFSDSMIFVDLKKVLDRNNQRSFSMFFTPNEEYARRYSGLWSLNKRPVFVHKLQVKEGRPITGIKVIDASVVPDSIDNLELAKGMCGPTEDGTINGIKIEQKLDDSASVEEYYICNPEIWFDLVETWMQFGSTEWIKITKENTKTIQVPPNKTLNVGEKGAEDVSLAEVQ